MNTSTRRVDLTQSEVHYLQTAGFLPPALLQRLREVRWRSATTAALELSPATAEEFREAFTRQLATVGFDEAYEPTAEGSLLEDLIDRFLAR